MRFLFMFYLHLLSCAIFQTCKEMYHADSEEKRRKSLLSNTACLETIAEGRQQRAAAESQKVMKSKGVQVSRNFEDSLRRYHPIQHRSKFWLFSRDFYPQLIGLFTQHHRSHRLKASHAVRKSRPCHRPQVALNERLQKAASRRRQRQFHLANRRRAKSATADQTATVQSIAFNASVVASECINQTPVHQKICQTRLLKHRVGRGERKSWSTKTRMAKRKGELPVWRVRLNPAWEDRQKPITEPLAKVSFPHQPRVA